MSIFWRLYLEQLLKEAQRYAEFTGLTVVVIFTILSVLVGFLAGREKDVSRRVHRHREDSEEPFQAAIDRLEDARQEFLRQRMIVRSNKMMNGFLKIGQYIIGGLLASAFIQQSLSPNMVGVLGVLVLISSLIYQHFRPDIQLRGALERLARLRSIIRDAEDDLYSMSINSPKGLSIEDFRRKISAGLSAIETSEWQDLTTRISGEVQTGSITSKQANSAKEGV